MSLVVGALRSDTELTNEFTGSVVERYKRWEKCRKQRSIHAAKQLQGSHATVILQKEVTDHEKY